MAVLELRAISQAVDLVWRCALILLKCNNESKDMNTQSKSAHIQEASQERMNQLSV